ncbi:O-antigen polysaccharide polymerase Wzy [Massilimicrobiota timonensis]|uniref:O-antigen polysaccharide polymerase Wzy n=1 Tax=Massilimicrobiota timonensis TaxID=1776392 RepID=A0A1Y4SUM0_9FIRM|nr:O-antigen polysaccharide polymerase Wzy [Massilimicrobiota timonensis]OUQ33618.1 hypothetical protein B5E75_09445 [Massilimicrobiota timonensis]
MIKFQKYASIFSIILFCILGVFLIFSLLNIYNLFIDYSLNIMGYVLVIWIIYTWKSSTKESIFTPYIIFMIFIVLFNYGQPLLWAFNIISDTDITNYLFLGTNLVASKIDIQNLKILTCIMIYALHFGAILSTSFKKTEKYSNVNYDRYILLVGYIFAIISVPLTLYRYLTFLSISSVHGYGAIYYSNDFQLASLTFIVEMFFFPSLLCILLGGKFKKKYQIIVWSIMLFYTIINLSMGDRGTWLYKIIILIWLEFYYYQPKIDFKKIMLYILLLLPFLYIVYAIVELRDYGKIEITSIIKELGNIEFPLISALREMGGSMNILAYIYIYGASFWNYGNTYIPAILGVISSRYFPMLGLQVILIDDYFSQYLNLSYGTGFSLFGECYLNFGIFSVLFLLILGYVLGLLFRNNSNHFSNIRLFIIASSLSTLIGWIRGSSFLYFKSFFYGVIVFYLLIVLLSRIKINGRRL